MALITGDVDLLEDGMVKTTYSNYAHEQTQPYFYTSVQEAVRIINDGDKDIVVTVDGSPSIVKSGLELTFTNIIQFSVLSVVNRQKFRVESWVTAAASNAERVVYALLQPGLTMGEKIQNAFNVPIPNGATRLVITPSGLYTVDTLKLNSNTKWEMRNTKVKLRDGANERLLTNSDHVNGNENIHIYGFGDAELNGNAVGQNTSLNNYKNIGIHFYKCNRISMRFVTIASTAKWSVVVEGCNDVDIVNPRFDLEGYVNQDGVHILGPSSNIRVTGLSGTFGDDACVVNARDSGTGTVWQGEGGGGDITGVIFSNVHVRGASQDGVSHTGVLRVSAGALYKADGIHLIGAIADGIGEAALRIGGNAETTAEQMKNITVNGLHIIKGYGGSTSFGALCQLYRPCKNLVIENVTMSKQCKPIIFTNSDQEVKGLTIRNVRMETDIGSLEYPIQFKRANITDVTLDNIVVDNTRSSSTLMEGIYFVDANVKNFEANNITFTKAATAVKSTVGSTFENARFSNFKFNNVTTKFNFPSLNGIMINGVGVESANAETPTTSKWSPGDIVDFTDTGDGSGNGTYLLLLSGTWKKFAS